MAADHAPVARRLVLPLLSVGLLTACSSAPAPISLPHSSPGVLAKGAALFSAQCAICHGPQGGGGSAVALNRQGSVAADYPSASALYTLIKNAMPQNDPGSLSTQQAKLLTIYVRHLSSKP